MTGSFGCCVSATDRSWISLITSASNTRRIARSDGDLVRQRKNPDQEHCSPSSELRFALENRMAVPYCRVMAEDRRVQQFSPVLVYDDAQRAIQFLTEAFGFTEHAVHRTPDGAIAHAELAYGGGYVGLADRIDGSIFDLGPCAIYVVVDDPDAHHAHAVAAGAEVVFPLTDQDYGSRDYAVRDAEGFVWCFGTYAPGSSEAST